MRIPNQLRFYADMKIGALADTLVPEGGCMFFSKKYLAVILVTWLVFGVPYGLAVGHSGASHPALGKVMTVATFDPTQPQLPEGIAIDKQGNIYGGFYPTGQIWKMTPDGEQSILATLDVGSTGGGLVGFALDEEGDLYVCDSSLSLRRTASGR
jgi:hypothetical protein